MDRERLQTLVQVATSIGSKPIPIVSLPCGGFPRAVRKSRRVPKNAPRVVNDRQGTSPVRRPGPPPPDPWVLTDGPSSYDTLRLTTPTSIKSVVLLTGIRRSCFFQRAFPGCIDYRVPSFIHHNQITRSSLGSYPDDSRCIDRLGGVPLPEPEQVSHQPPFRSVVETFPSHSASLTPTSEKSPSGHRSDKQHRFPFRFVLGRFLWDDLSSPR